MIWAECENMRKYTALILPTKQLMPDARIKNAICWYKHGNLAVDAYM